MPSPFVMPRTVLRRCAAAVAVGAVIVAAGTAAAAAEWHVSPRGDDAWSGTRAEPDAARTDGPFATLERARDAIRARRKSGLDEAVTVFVHGGDYLLSRTFQLAPEDSGTADKPVVWQAFRAEKPRLVGGRAIGGWQAVADDERSGGRLLAADLAAQGLGTAAVSQLVFAGRRQPRARWPNHDPANPYGGGWAYVDGEVRPMYAEIPGEDKRSLVMRSVDLRGWARPTDGEVCVFPRYNWWNNIVRIESFAPADRRLTLAADCSYAIRPGDRYFVQGLREELDAPGEWYHDREAGRLLFLPPEPLGDRPVFVPTLATILSIQPDTAHVTIRGLAFECCEGTAVVVSRARHCRIAGCTVTNVGGYSGGGVSVSGSDNAVVGCDVSHTGAHGIAIDGGDRRTLAAAGNAAENNYIHHTGTLYKQGVGVSLTGVGNRVAHNLIHDCPRMGIMFSGNNLVIELNRIRHVNLETEDTGAVYTGGRDWISSRGSLIRWNHFHDILGYGREGDAWVSPHFAWGVYLDDNAGGVDVIGNLIERCPRAGIHLHNGRDNRLENNVIVDCGLQQVECNGWRKEDGSWTSHLDAMVKGYESVAAEPAWRGMRNMKTHPRDAVLPDGLIMTGNEFRRNIVDWRGADAKLFAFRNLPLAHWISEDNVVWHHGLPIVTGQSAVGGVRERVAVADPGFEAEAAGGLPRGWQWQMKPVDAVAARATVDAAAGGPGGHALSIAAGAGRDAAGKPLSAQVVSAPFPVVPGGNYRLRARMKADAAGTKASLMLQSHVSSVFFWANSPHEATIGTDWQPVEFVFRMPAPGERGHHAEMKQGQVRIDLAGAGSRLLVDDVTLEIVDMLDGWASWRAAGFDARSVVADPLFVDRDRGDYRLRPESPALRLGFAPIPFERIGPHADELRASWPIVEAEGARERPLGMVPLGMVPTGGGATGGGNASREPAP